MIASARVRLVVLSAIPLLFFSVFLFGFRAPAQEELPKVGQDTAAEKAVEGKLPVVKGDCYLLARAAKQARDKAAAARMSSEEANKAVEQAKVALAGAEKTAGETNAAADDADKEASAAESEARSVIAQCIEKIRQSEALLGVTKPVRVKAASKGEQ